MPPVGARVFETRYPPIDHGDHCRLPLGNATQPFEEDTLVEGHDERDNRLHWEARGIDLVKASMSTARHCL